MSNLKELIDHLYNEVIQAKEATADTIDLADDWEDTSFDAERLLQVLTQMTACLQREDLSDYQEATVLDADQTSRLLIQWEGLCNSMEGLNRHMKELETDIAKMQPWGDFDVVKLEQLRQHGCEVLFWTMPVDVFASQSAEPWFIESQALLVSQDTTLAYFITLQLGKDEISMPAEACRAEICPCPVSTLIMLQTRYKDSLKRLKTRQGDFALAHYAELRETLRSILPAGTPLPGQKQSHRQQLRAKLRKIFMRQ